MEVIVLVKCLIATLCGFIVYLLGGLDNLSIALIAFMIIDYLSGLICAWMNKEISSEIGFQGIVKKIVQLCVVSVAYMIENITGGGLPLRELTIMFFLANEGLSILENAASLGLPMPDKLRGALVQIKGENQHTQDRELSPKDDRPNDDPLE